MRTLPSQAGLMLTSHFPLVGMVNWAQEKNLPRVFGVSESSGEVHLTAGCLVAEISKLFQSLFCKDVEFQNIKTSDHQDNTLALSGI